MTLSQAMADEIRSRIARLPSGKRPTQKDIADRLSGEDGKARSQNYVSIRLRGQASFLLDDLEVIAEMLETTPQELYQAAWVVSDPPAQVVGSVQPPSESRRRSDRHRPRGRAGH